jgi:very-short-patch-repair endonuclease
MSAARLRQLSLPEQLLWRLLRQMRGTLKIRRQHPIGPFVADFYCPAARLIIETDGAAHEQRQSRDQQRDAYMQSLGLKVVRFRATEILTDPEGTADAVMRPCSAVAGPSTTKPFDFAQG